MIWWFKVILIVFCVTSTNGWSNLEYEIRDLVYLDGDIHGIGCNLNYLNYNFNATMDWFGEAQDVVVTANETYPYFCNNLLGPTNRNFSASITNYQDYNNGTTSLSLLHNNTIYFQVYWFYITSDSINFASYLLYMYIDVSYQTDITYSLNTYPCTINNISSKLLSNKAVKIWYTTNNQQKRVDMPEWTNWVNNDGYDKVLLPVSQLYEKTLQNVINGLFVKHFNCNNYSN